MAALASSTSYPSKAVEWMLDQALDVVRKSREDAPPLPENAQPSRDHPVPKQYVLTWQRPGFVAPATLSFQSYSHNGLDAEVERLNRLTLQTLHSVQKAVSDLQEYLRELSNTRRKAEQDEIGCCCFFRSTRPIEDYSRTILNHPWKGLLARIERVVGEAKVYFADLDRFYETNRYCLETEASIAKRGNRQPSCY